MALLTKRSRYYRLKDTTFPDHKGVERHCKSVRRGAVVAGRFFHTLEAGDRLDQLAYKYYRQSLHWWRICDANPDFLTPLALLDKTATAQVRIELSTTDNPPSLAELYREIGRVTGVEKVVRVSEGGVPEREISDTAPLFSLPDSLIGDLEEGLRTQQVSAALELALQAEAVVLSPNIRITQPGPGLWQIEDREAFAAYRLHHDTGTTSLNVNRANVTFRLVLLVDYNRHNTNESQLSTAVGTAGFSIEEITEQTRIGQSLVIPPRFTGLNGKR